MRRPQRRLQVGMLLFGAATADHYYYQMQRAVVNVHPWMN